MSDEQRRQDLQRASDLVPVTELDFNAVLRDVRRRLVMETAAATLIVLTICTLFGWIAFLVHGAVGNQGSIQGLLRPAPSGPMMRGEDLIVGIPISLTGAQSREGAFAKQGYDMWVDWINSQGGVAVRGVRHRVKLVYSDDQSGPTLSAQVTQSLITNEKVRFLLGSSAPGTIASEAMVAENNRIPLVQGNGAAVSIFSRGYKYTFGVLSPANQYVTSILDMAAAQNPRPSTVALLSADDSFSQEVAAAALDHAPTKGFKVVVNQKYPNGATDLSGFISEVKAKTPDILLNAGHLDEAIAINKAARNLKLDAKIIAYTIGRSPTSYRCLAKTRILYMEAHSGLHMFSTKPASICRLESTRRRTRRNTELRRTRTTTWPGPPPPPLRSRKRLKGRIASSPARFATAWRV